VLALALWSHDRRSDWTRFVEDWRTDAALATFAGDGLAYWENGLTLQWLKLRRPAGFGCYQGAGLVFFRGMATEFRRRYEALGELDTIDFERQPGQVCPPRRNPDREGPEMLAQLTDACRAMPELDAIILARPVPGAAVTTWQAPAEMVRSQLYAVPVTRSFYRYDCAALR
jgi:hypothetical protein